MKKIVGRRAVVNREGRAIGMLIDLFASGSFRPSRVQFDQTCASCKAPVKIILTEDLNTGEIWLEGPDKCDKCGHQLSNEKAEIAPLSQDAINHLFGPVIAS